MKPVFLPATPNTPEIHFDPVAHLLRISGHCQPTRPDALFNPLFELLRRHFSLRQPLLFTLDLSLEYVDKGGLQALRELFSLVDAEGRSGRWIELIWTAPALDSTFVDTARGLLHGLSNVELLVREPAIH